MTENYKNEIEGIDEKVENPQRSRLNNIFGSIEVVSSVPSAVPVTLDQQIKIYVSGGTSRLYVYDSSVGTWKYATLT